MSGKLAITVGMIVAAWHPAFGQTGKSSPRFEVASIKPSAPGEQGCVTTQSSPLQFSRRGCTIRSFVSGAWSLMPYELSVPTNLAWISSVRYDITAKSSTPASPVEHWHMLGPLLEERCHLKFHREKRELAVYYLSASKRGLKLPVTKPGSCMPWDHNSPPPPPLPNRPPSCDYILMPGTPDRLGLGMEGTGVPMASFISRLTELLGRPVIDRTGFTGIFDIHLMFSTGSVPALARLGGASAQPGDPTGFPDIFTAIRGLGMNIESGKGPVDVFVIDSAQKPSEN